MKKILAGAAIIALMATLSLVFSARVAKASDEVLFYQAGNDVRFTIEIPEQWNNYIVQESSGDGINFKFKKADGSKEFLFSINKISDQQWIVIKEQLGNAKLLAHKGTIIYYSQVTDKAKVKGTGNEEYAKIYSHLDDIIKSIKITE